MLFGHRESFGFCDFFFFSQKRRRNLQILTERGGIWLSSSSPMSRCSYWFIKKKLKKKNHDPSHFSVETLRRSFRRRFKAWSCHLKLGSALLRRRSCHRNYHRTAPFEAWRRCCRDRLISGWGSRCRLLSAPWSPIPHEGSFPCFPLLHSWSLERNC